MERGAFMCHESAATPAAYARRCSAVHGGPAGRPVLFTNSSNDFRLTCRREAASSVSCPREVW